MKNGMLISFLASLLGLFGCSKGNTEEYKAADIYKDLRQKVLTIDPVALGLKPTSTSGPVWGVLVETGYPKAVATLVTIGGKGTWGQSYIIHFTHMEKGMGQTQ